MSEFLGKYGKVIATSLALVAMIGVGSTVFAGDLEEGTIGKALHDKVTSVADVLGLGGGGTTGSEENDIAGSIENGTYDTKPDISKLSSTQGVYQNTEGKWVIGNLEIAKIDTTIDTSSISYSSSSFQNMQFVEGMTWSEYINSEYNTIGIEKVHDIYVYDYVYPGTHIPNTNGRHGEATYWYVIKEHDPPFDNPNEFVTNIIHKNRKYVFVYDQIS